MFLLFRGDMSELISNNSSIIEFRTPGWLIGYKHLGTVTAKNPETGVIVRDIIRKLDKDRLNLLNAKSHREKALGDAIWSPRVGKIWTWYKARDPEKNANDKFLKTIHHVANLLLTNPNLDILGVNDQNQVVSIKHHFLESGKKQQLIKWLMDEKYQLC